MKNVFYLNYLMWNIVIDQSNPLLPITEDQDGGAVYWRITEEQDWRAVLWLVDEIAPISVEPSQSNHLQRRSDSENSSRT